MYHPHNFLVIRYFRHIIAENTLICGIAFMKYVAYLFLAYACTSLAASPPSSKAPSSPTSQDKEMMEYCQSLVEDGTPEKDIPSQIKACIDEQKANEEDTTNQDGAADAADEVSDPKLNACYDKVDAYIEKQLDTNPSASDQYDSLLNDCVKGNMPK
jgi:hypothetical protein